MIHRRILASVAVAGLAAWGLSLAPLVRPRAVVSDVDVSTYKFWFSADSRLFGTNDYVKELGYRLRVFRVTDGQPVAFLYAGQEQFEHLIFSPDGQEIAGITAAGAIVIWETTTGRQQARFNRTIDPDDVPLLRYTETKTLLVQDVKALQQKLPILRMVEVATDQEVLATPLHGLSREFSLGNHPKTFPRHAAFLNNSADWRLFELATGQPAGEWKAPFNEYKKGPFNYDSMAFSADGSVAALNREGKTFTECLVAASQKGEWVHLTALDNNLSIDLSHTGEFVAASLGRVQNKAWYQRWLPTASPIVRVVHVPDGDVVADFHGGSAMRFAPDGRTLAVFSNKERQVLLWDFPRRRPWGCILVGIAVAVTLTYLPLAWRARRRAGSALR
jgi:WD40 repeat protein